MRRSNVIAAAIGLLLAVDVLAQATTHTILLDWNPIGAASCGYFMGTRNVQYMDTAGSNWSYLKVRIPLAVTRVETGTGPGPASTISIAINGVPVGNPAVVANNAINCGPWITYEFGATTLPGYQPFGQNTVTINSVGGHAGNAGEKAELIFTTEPRKFAFDLLPSMSQRLLIHKRPNDTYPSPWQVETSFLEKPRYRFRGAVTSTTASLEADVWLRVIDPADTSSYLPAPSANDNRDSLPKGVLMTRNCSDPSCHAASGAPLQIHAAPGGVVELELEATDRHAGDNYHLEASFDPQFTCATAGANGANLCARSGLVTAWKRIYVENDRMFRAGAMLTQNVVPCVGPVGPPPQCPATTIIHVDNAVAIAHANQLRLIHAPRFDGVGPLLFYSEDVNVIRVNRRQNTVEISNPVRSYYGPDTLSLTSLPYLADAVGQIGGNNDFFSANTTSLGGLFAPAFVEYVDLPGDPVPFIPYREVVAGQGTTGETDEVRHLARKWFHYYGDDNVQHIIGASANASSGQVVTLGRTAARDGTNFAWIFVDSIEGEIHNNNRRWAFNGEVTSHEIGHEWRVNPAGPTSGHCAERRWNASDRWCTMHGSYSDFGICHGVCPGVLRHRGRVPLCGW